MAVGVIGGPRLCESLLATSLGLFTGEAREWARYQPSEKNISPLAKQVGIRRIATRYDKLAWSYLSALCLVAAVSFWL